MPGLGRPVGIDVLVGRVFRQLQGLVLVGPGEAGEVTDLDLLGSDGGERQAQSRQQGSYRYQACANPPGM